MVRVLGKSALLTVAIIVGYAECAIVATWQDRPVKEREQHKRGKEIRGARQYRMEEGRLRAQGTRSYRSHWVRKRPEQTQVRLACQTSLLGQEVDHSQRYASASSQQSLRMLNSGEQGPSSQLQGPKPVHGVPPLCWKLAAKPLRSKPAKVVWTAEMSMVA